MADLSSDRSVTDPNIVGKIKLVLGTICKFLEACILSWHGQELLRELPVKPQKNQAKYDYL